jgi:hypothetical protein
VDISSFGLSYSVLSLASQSYLCLSRLISAVILVHFKALIRHLFTSGGFIGCSVLIFGSEADHIVAVRLFGRYRVRGGWSGCGNGEEIQGNPATARGN